MTRALTVSLTLALAAGFVVGDVVSLPSLSRPVSPRVAELGITVSDGVVLTGAAAALTSASSPDLPVPGAVPAPAADPLAAQAADPLGAGAAGTTPVPQPPAPEDDVWFVSDQLDTQDFAVAGVTWASGGVAPGGVEVRLREADGWTGWTSLGTNDEGPDAGTAEYEAAAVTTGTDPLLTEGADAVQVRLPLSGGRLPEDLQVVVIDPGTSPADGTSEQSVPLTGAQAGGGYKPEVISRAEWGADETLRSCSVSYSSSTKAAVVHHTAGENTYSAAGSAAVVRGIYAYHTRSLGWCDIGYNVLVDKYGRIYEGRAGGLDRAVVGAHAGGFNAGTFGVSAMGNYSTAAAPAEMLRAIGDIIGWKLGAAGVDPQGTARLTSAGGGTARYASGAVVTLPAVLGHREVGRTECPGTNLFAALDVVRARAQSQISQSNFVRALYVDMLSRTPGDSEVAYWVPRVTASGAGFVAGGFSGSEEYRKKSIRAAYVDSLGRQPDPQGVEHWYQAVLQGRAHIDGIRPYFLASQEFFNQAGGTDDGWIRLIFSRALQRQPTAGDVAYWRSVLRSQGRDAVIKGIYNSGESAGVRVDRSYQAWLGRTAGGWERQYWTDLVIKQGDETMRQAVMTSTEYHNRAQTR